jgi:hypothetical protein
VEASHRQCHPARAGGPPDVVAVGSGTALCNISGSASTSYGTSFSAPLVAGLVAGFWQANPHLTAQEVTYCIRKSGHQFTTPDILLGYGYANFSRANTIAQNELSISAIEPNADLVSIKILPSNKANVEIRFSNSLINNNLRIVFIQQITQQIIYQDTFTLTANQTGKTISFDMLSPDILLRIEDLTQKKTLKIMILYYALKITINLIVEMNNIKSVILVIFIIKIINKFKK